MENLMEFDFHAGGWAARCHRPVSEITNIFHETHYRLIRPIAEGGMGIVYQAEQKGAGGFSKLVAIKLIREELSFFDEFQDNFVGEARLVADLIHTNIVQTYHLGEFSEQFFIVMEFVNGWNLDEFIEAHRRKGAPVPVDWAVFIASRVCRGLQYAHAKTDAEGRPLGIVHRDINPKNIMITREGDVKITDFGIAKALDLMHCEEGEVISGKDDYLSPEQVRKEVTDGRADLFSVGIVLVEMLLGKNIFRGETGPECHRNILEMPLPSFRDTRPEIDEKLDPILKKLLSRGREDRHADAGALLGDLERYLYSDRYGPTNEKLAAYLHELFETRADGREANEPQNWTKPV